MQSLLILTPIEPCKTGNGLAMRAAAFVEGASRTHEVSVAVLPVLGSLPHCPEKVEAGVTVVPPIDHQVLRRDFAELIADPRWRSLLTEIGPVPPLARGLSPGLARWVLEVTGTAEGTPVHVMRSYMAPLGLSVAQRLGSIWVTLDLDDDDAALTRNLGAETEASAYDRLVGAFAHLFSGVSLASPQEVETIGLRHRLKPTVVPNAVPIPEEASRRSRSEDVTLLFVANYYYGPNLEAASVLVEEVAPRVAQLIGRAVHVLLVGNVQPGSALLDLSNRRDVSVAGFVENLRPWYAQADAVVAPFEHGSGTRIKLLEAFAHRVPVITTPVGASGLGVAHMENVVIGRTTDELAQGTARVVEDPELAERLAASAFEFVSQSHSQDVATGCIQEFMQSAARLGRVNL